MMIKTGLILLGTVVWLSGSPLPSGENAEHDSQTAEPKHPPHRLAEVVQAYILDNCDRNYWAW